MGLPVPVSNQPSCPFSPIFPVPQKIFFSSESAGKVIIGRTTDVNVSVDVHNSIHCNRDPENPCVWPDCLEYCKGDHFMITSTVRISSAILLGPAMPRFPMQWRDEERWEKGFAHAKDLLPTLYGALKASTDADLRHSGEATQRWLADAVAWIMAVLGGLVRDV